MWLARYPVPVHVTRNGAVFQACCASSSKPSGDLAKFVPTTSIKEANKHVEDVMSRGKGRQEYQSNRYRVRIVYVSRFTSAGKLFISDRSPSVFVDVVVSNTACKCYIAYASFSPTCVHYLKWAWYMHVQETKTKPTKILFFFT